MIEPLLRRLTESTLILYLKQHLVLILFVIFGVLVLFQHLSMGMYFDDFGYASLSYANPNFDMQDQQYHVQDILEYLGFHYNHWGGRVLFFFIQIILLQGGIELFAIFQSLTITGIFYLIYKIIKQNVATDRYDWLIALLSIASYGMIGIMTFRDAVFWATASILYIFPILFVLLFVYLYRRFLNRNPSKVALYLAMPLLAFIASFSQEQIGAAMFVIVILYPILIYIFTNVKPRLWQILCVILSAAGLAMLLLAPGNAARMSTSSSEFYTKSLVERFSEAGLNMATTIFSPHNGIFVFLLLAFCLFISSYIMLGKKHSKLYQTISLVAFILSACIITFSLATQRSLASFTENLALYLSTMTILALLTLLMTIFVLLKHKNFQLITLLFSGLASQAVMLMAPYYPLRSFIFFIIVFFIISISVIFIRPKLPPRILLMIALPLILFAAYNYATITNGYYRNNPINKSNHQTLVKASKSVKQGEIVTEINLKKIPDHLYSQITPYQDDYTMVLLRNYYKIPKNVKIIYK